MADLKKSKKDEYPFHYGFVLKIFPSKVIALVFATAIIIPIGTASACISDVGKSGSATTNCIGESYTVSEGYSSGYSESGSEGENEVCDAEHNCSEAQGTNTGETDCIDAQGNVGEGTDTTCGTETSADDEGEENT